MPQALCFHSCGLWVPSCRRQLRINLRARLSLISFKLSPVSECDYTIDIRYIRIPRAHCPSPDTCSSSSAPTLVPATLKSRIDGRQPQPKPSNPSTRSPESWDCSSSIPAELLFGLKDTSRLRQIVWRPRTTL